MALFLLSATFGSSFRILVDQNYLPLLDSLIFIQITLAELPTTRWKNVLKVKKHNSEFLVFVKNIQAKRDLLMNCFQEYRFFNSRILFNFLLFSQRSESDFKVVLWCEFRWFESTQKIGAPFDFWLHLLF